MELQFSKTITNPRSHKDQRIEELVTKLGVILEQNRVKFNKGDFTEDVELGNIVKGHLDELHRYILQFQTNKFFIAVFGALKAGKSTLMNALVGKHVSPTGYGQETTLHCSIILKADAENPEGLYLLCSKGAMPSNDDEKKRARDLLDCYRGLKSWDKIERLNRSSRLFFTGNDLDPKKNNLEKVLTEKAENISKYPNLVLVEIRVDWPADTTLDKIALFDMPGLDGAIANQAEDPIIKELKNSADFFIYVQSSIGAITRDAAVFIKSICNKQREMVVGFNQFQGKYWLCEESQKRLLQSSQTDAAKHLAKTLGIAQPVTYPLNAAQAWDAANPEFDVNNLSKKYASLKNRKDKLDALLKDSQIADLKQHIEDVCHNSLTEIQDKNGLVDLNAWLNECLKEESDLSLYISRQRVIKEKLEKEYEAWKKVTEDLKTFEIKHEDTEKGLSQKLTLEKYLLKIAKEIRNILENNEGKAIFADIESTQLSKIDYPDEKKINRSVQYMEWDKEMRPLLSAFRQKCIEKIEDKINFWETEIQNAYKAIVDEQLDMEPFPLGKLLRDIQNLKNTNDDYFVVGDPTETEDTLSPSYQLFIGLLPGKEFHPSEDSPGDEANHKKNYRVDLIERVKVCLDNGINKTVETLKKSIEELINKIREKNNERQNGNYDRREKIDKQIEAAKDMLKTFKDIRNFMRRQGL